MATILSILKDKYRRPVSIVINWVGWNTSSLSSATPQASLCYRFKQIIISPHCVAFPSMTVAGGNKYQAKILFSLSQLLGQLCSHSLIIQINIVRFCGFRFVSRTGNENNGTGEQDASRAEIHASTGMVKKNPTTGIKSKSTDESILLYTS